MYHRSGKPGKGTREPRPQTPGHRGPATGGHHWQEGALYLESIFGNRISGSNQWKHCAGIYFNSRVKEHMVLQTLASNRFDADNELNIGVISDELVGPSTVGSNSPS